MAAWLICAAACGPTISVTPISSPGRDLRPRPASEVQIFRARPDRRHLEVANIVVEDEGTETTAGDLMRALKTRAGEMGCDALLLGSNTSAAGGSFITRVTSLGGICIVWEEGA